MRHHLAIIVASALLVIGSQTLAAADSGSLSPGSQDSHTQPRVQADGSAVPVAPSSDSQLFAAGMSSDPATVAKGHDDKDKDKDKNRDGHHHRDGNHGRDRHENHDKDKDGSRDHDWGRGGDSDNGDGGGNTPPSPTPEPGTLLLTGLVAASAGLRARRARKSG